MILYTEDKEVIKEVKKILIDKELSLADVARKLDMLPQTLNGILNRKKLEFADIQRICNAIDCELLYSIVDRKRIEYIEKQVENTLKQIQDPNIDSNTII